MEYSLVLAAFLAGMLMFLAPCTLPIIPGYLAFIGQGKPMRNACAFVIGFSVVFIALGLFAGSLGTLVGPYRELLGRVAGAIIILFGLTMLGLRLPVLSAERRVQLPAFLVVGKVQSSFLIGVLFALGWSPCIGPILGTALLFASSGPTASWGAIMLAFFSVGFAIPFLLTAYFLESSSKLFGRFSTSALWLSRVGGVLLVLIGAFMLFGNAGLMTAWLTEHTPIFSALLPYL